VTLAKRDYPLGKPTLAQCVGLRVRLKCGIERLDGEWLVAGTIAFVCRSARNKGTLSLALSRRTMTEVVASGVSPSDLEVAP
jgi:hypothetical protein